VIFKFADVFYFFFFPHFFLFCSGSSFTSSPPHPLLLPRQLHFKNCFKKKIKTRFTVFLFCMGGMRRDGTCNDFFAGGNAG